MDEAFYQRAHCLHYAIETPESLENSKKKLGARRHVEGVEAGRDSRLPDSLCPPRDNCACFCRPQRNRFSIRSLASREECSITASCTIATTDTKPDRTISEEFPPGCSRRSARRDRSFEERNAVTNVRVSIRR